MTRAPALVAASHGTSSPEGQAAVAALVDAVRRAAPGLAVEDAFVDVQQPDVPTVLDALGAGHETVVVPLLLSAGYHVHVDLVRELEGRDGAPVLGAALGPDDRLVEVLVERLAEVGLRTDDRVVLAAAGSSDLRAVVDCRTIARLLSARLRRPVTMGFLSAARPSVADAVARTKATHPVSRVVVASYLLAPGYFHDLAADAGAHLTTAPILRADAAPPTSLVDLVLDRYRGAVLTRAA